MTAAPAAVVEGVSFAYDARGPHVVFDVSWSFADGAVTALLGPNGSGKTTLLNLILGWLTPTAGWVRVNGHERAGLSRREWSRQVGLVPQDEAAAFELELAEYVLLGRAPYLGLLERPGAADRAAVESALTSIGLASYRERAVNALSGGERQLASIARALVQNPHVLLLDEPMSHLDLANTRRVLRLLAALRRQGHAVILTTHDPNVAAAVADAAVLLRGGRLVAAGPVAEVLTSAHLGATYDVEVEVHTAGGRTLVVPKL